MSYVIFPHPFWFFFHLSKKWFSSNSPQTDRQRYEGKRHPGFYPRQMILQADHGSAWFQHYSQNSAIPQGNQLTRLPVYCNLPAFLPRHRGPENPSFQALHFPLQKSISPSGDFPWFPGQQLIQFLVCLVVIFSRIDPCLSCVGKLHVVFRAVVKGKGNL